MCDRIPAVMAVFHITYKYHPQTSNADYDGFYKVIVSYKWARLSDSNWVLNADEAPKALWLMLKRNIDPDDYLVMLPLEEPSSCNAQAHATLKWLLSRP